MAVTGERSQPSEGLRIVNAHGASAVFSPFGARLIELRVPDRQGELDNVLLGFDEESDYRSHVDLYFGATIGRVAGRISNARFELDGRAYQLAANEGRSALHGGPQRAFDRVEWKAEFVQGEHGAGIRFRYLSPDGEEGYPGNLRVEAEYALSDDNELWTTFTAVPDAPTPVNLTSHAYWNLAGAGADSILDHELMIAAGEIVALDEELVPTGGFAPVSGTPHDFRRPRPIGPSLPVNGTEPWPGFDSAYALDERDPDADPAVSLFDPSSGRLLEILTAEPSIQMYTANRLPRMTGRHGRSYGPGNSICLEPQRFPDAVNRPEFPSIVVAPGEDYVHVSRYRFSVR